MELKGIQVVSANQINFGKLLGLDLNGQSVGIAIALIQDEIDRQFWGKDDLGSPSEKQIKLATKFGIDITGCTKTVGAATIDDIMHHLNIQAIESEGLAPGLRVRIKGKPTEEHIISSIREDGTVFFKGGNGKKAWARSLEKVSV